MSLPIVAEKSPSVLELEAGKTYYWCRCGRSQNQPFCDGSHEGTGLVPEEFTVDRTKNYALCRCKQTGNQPFCDGTHSKV
jgi:CDGSH-type Zn-finger protein